MSIAEYSEFPSRVKFRLPLPNKNRSRGTTWIQNSFQKSYLHSIVTMGRRGKDGTFNLRNTSFFSNVCITVCFKLLGHCKWSKWKARYSRVTHVTLLPRIKLSHNASGFFRCQYDIYLLAVKPNAQSVTQTKKYLGRCSFQHHKNSGQIVWFAFCRFDNVWFIEENFYESWIVRNGV